MKQALVIILFGLVFLSNDRTKPKENNIVESDSKIRGKRNISPRTIRELFNKALITESLEFNNEFEFDSLQSFLFFKSGYFLDKTEKNAITIQCKTDTTYSIKLYVVKDQDWQRIDSISGLDAFPWQFDVKFEDYNFDGQKDIYIQVSASNGWSLSRGHMLIIDPSTKKFILHNETRDFANMRPDPNTETIFTELWNGYNTQGQHQLTIFKNKWINGQLKTVSEKDTTFN